MLVNCAFKVFMFQVIISCSFWKKEHITVDNMISHDLGSHFGFESNFESKYISSSVLFNHTTQISYSVQDRKDSKINLTTLSKYSGLVNMCNAFILAATEILPLQTLALNSQNLRRKRSFQTVCKRPK